MIYIINFKVVFFGRGMLVGNLSTGIILHSLQTLIDKVIGRLRSMQNTLVKKMANMYTYINPMY